VSLKEVVLCLNRSLLGQFLREICPFQKRTPFSGRIYAAVAGVLLTGPEKGVLFWGEHISLKNGTFCPLLATIQALSNARVFLLCRKYSRMVCMGCTFTANKPLPLNNCPKQFEYSRLSRRSGAKLYPRGDY
jgi:hypothetical protein